MRWLFHPLLLLIARSTESELAKQVEFLKAENQMLRRRLPKNVRPTAAEWELLLQLGRGIGNAAVAALIGIVAYSSYLRRLRAARLRAGESVRGWRRRPGRPRTPEDVRVLIVRLARENPGWGYTRVLGELKKLDLKAKVSRTTVVNILRSRGHDPKLDPTKGRWADFLRAHAQSLWQCDFFYQRRVAPAGLWRYCFALVFVHVATRRVIVSPCTRHPTSAWVAGQARRFAAEAQGCGLPVDIVLRDNDSRFSREFDDAMTAVGARVQRLPFRAPNTNAYVERFVQSIKQECLDHFVIFGPEHMDVLVREYVEHYHTERPHQGKGNMPLVARPPTAAMETSGEIVCRERLGGVLRHYYRAAA